LVQASGATPVTHFPESSSPQLIWPGWRICCKRELAAEMVELNKAVNLFWLAYLLQGPQGPEDLALI
jgi:hypothetical protein